MLKLKVYYEIYRLVPFNISKEGYTDHRLEKALTSSIIEYNGKLENFMSDLANRNDWLMVGNKYVKVIELEVL